MPRVKLNGVVAGQGFLAVIVGLFGNKVSDFVDLPRLWLITFFIILLIVSVLLQALKSNPQREVVSLPRNGAESQNVPSHTPRVWRNLAFPLGLILGSLFALLMVLLDRREGMWPISVFVLFPAHIYEIRSSVAAALACGAYRWLIGVQGLGLFGLGCGLGVGIAIVTIRPEENVPIFTLYAHAVVPFAIALTLKTSRQGWKYALAIPAMVSSFAILVVIVSLLFSAPSTYQNGSLSYFAPGRHTHYYEVPFTAPPSLSVDLDYPTDARLRVLDQSGTSFSIEIESTEFPVSVWFEAQGIPAKN